jgi:uncharacterized protein YfaS (alpha-2-macroglobulin family)
MNFVKLLHEFFKKLKTSRVWQIGLTAVILILSVGVFAVVSSINKNLPADLTIDERIYGDFGEVEEADNSVLRVIQASPAGSVKEEFGKTEVSVIFNHPMKPLGVLEQTAPGVFTISPGVEGSFRWHGSRICTFIPDYGFDFDRKYTVTVRKGTTSINKKELQEDYTFDFTVQMPDLTVSVETDPWTNNTINYDQSFILVFNYPMNIVEFEKNFSIRENSNSVSYDAVFSERRNNTNSQRRRIKVTPLDRFERDSSVTLQLSKGLLANGSLAQLKENKSFSYKTHGPLKVSFNDNAKFYQDLYQTRIEFNNEVRTRDFDSYVSIEPEVPKSRNYYSESDTFYLSDWDVKPGERYTITVDELEDIHGNLLTNPQTFTVTVPNYRPGFYLSEGSNSILESKTADGIPVYVNSLKSLNVSAVTITLETIQKSVAPGKNRGLRKTLSFPQSENWSTGFSQNRMGRSGFSLKKYLSNNNTGWVALQFSQNIPNRDGNMEEQKSVQIVQATDLGLSVKEAFDKSYIWVHSLNDASPVSNATVKYYDGNTLVGEAITDDSGNCSIINKFGRHSDSAIYVVSHNGKDSAFVTSLEHQIPYWYYDIRFDEEGYKKQLLGQIVFDRKLYRPGDIVECKAFLAVRENGKLNPVRNEEVQFTLSNSEGKELAAETLTTSDEGGVNYTYETQKDAPLGHYQVKFIYMDKEHGRVNDTFQVEEFRPVSFAVDVIGLTTGKVGESKEVTVDGHYLFGAPMQNAPVKYSVFREKRSLSFGNYSAYTFSENNYWYRDYSDDEGYLTGSEGRLSPTGQYTFNIVPSRMDADEIISNNTTIQLSDVYDIKMEATVRDVDDKTVTKTAYARIYPGENVFGIRTLSRYQHKKNSFEFDLVALNNDGTDSGSVSAEILIVRSEYRSVLSVGPSGTLQTRWTHVKTIENSEDITLTNEPRRFTYNVPREGNYSIIVKEKSGQSYSRDSFYAWGGSGSYYSRNDSSLSLLPDKKEYNPGDTARILVQSPWEECTAVVTLERDSVYWQKSYPVTGDGTPLEIPIKDEYLPNVYCSVMLIRPRRQMPEGLSEDARKEFIEYDLGAPEFKTGAVKISVSNSSRRLKLELDTDRKSYAPADEMTITFNTEPGAEIALSSADLAVLNLVDYSFADPVNKFYQEWPNSIRILENRRHIIKQYPETRKGDSPGGQGKGDELEGDGGFNQQNEDGSRTDIRYTAYWNPLIKADSSGKAEVTFKLPQNLTTFRLMALAAKDGKYASLKKEIRVKKSIVVRRNLPRFIRPNDTLRMGAVITNQTEISSIFRVSLDTHLLQGNSKSSEINLGPGESKEVTFELSLDYEAYRKSLDEDPEDGEVHGIISGFLSCVPEDIEKFTAAGYAKDDIQDKLKFDLPVRQYYPSEAAVIAGFTDKQIEEFITIPNRSSIFTKTGSLDVTLSPTALTGIEHGFGFFTSNPYYCLEQRASAYLLALSTGNLLEHFDQDPAFAGYDFDEIESLFLDELQNFQNADGGFRAWKDSSFTKSNPYLTAYVLFVLETAKGKKVKVDKRIPDSLISRAGDYLTAYVAEPPKDSYSYVLESFTMIQYVLALQKRYNDSLTSFLMKNRDQLSIRAKAQLALAVAIGKRVNGYSKNGTTEKLYQDVINNMEIGTDKVSFSEPPGGYYRAYYSSGATTAAVLRMMIRLDEKSEIIPRVVRYLIANEKVWGTSHASAFSALALHDYASKFETRRGDFNATVKINNRNLFSSKLSWKKAEDYENSLPIAQLYDYGREGETYPLQFISENDNRLYYTAKLLYSPRAQAINARDEGIELYRYYYDSKGNHIRDLSQMKRGRIYTCKITVVTGRPMFNIVITDNLASTFEVVNTSFKTEASSLSPLVKRESPRYDDYWWAAPTYNMEFRDDKVVITQEYIPSGLHEFSYLIRPTVKGSCTLPPAEAKLMYEENVFGRTNADEIMIQ